MFKKGIVFFGLTEIGLGGATLIATAMSLLLGLCAKPLNILVFVAVSGLISLSLGIGVLLRNEYARKLLLFFAGWVILSKVLIFAKIMILSCELETTILSHLKNIASIIYHLLVILYFHNQLIKKEFKR